MFVSTIVKKCWFLMRHLLYFITAAALSVLVLGCSEAVKKIEMIDNPPGKEKVVIIPKKQTITAISDVRVDLSDLPGKPSRYAQQKDDLTMLLVDALKHQNFYKPKYDKGNTLKVTVTRINKNSKASVQAFAKVFNPAGITLYYVVFVEKGTNLTSLSNDRTKLANRLAKSLKAPVN